MSHCLSSHHRYLRIGPELGIDVAETSLHPLFSSPSLPYIYHRLFQIFSTILTYITHKPLCVHINGAPQFRSAIAAKLSGHRVVWHVNNTRANPLVFWIFQITAYLCADHFIVASNRAKTYFLDNYLLRSRPMTIIHAPIKPELYPVPAQNFNLNSSTIRIGSLGGFNAQKTLSYLHL